MSQLRQVEGRPEPTGFWCVEVSGGVEISPQMFLSNEKYKEELGDSVKTSGPGNTSGALTRQPAEKEAPPFGTFHHTLMANFDEGLLVLSMGQTFRRNLSMNQTH